MLYNVKCGLYHPIVYRESPLPGNQDKLLRFKSEGHHTEGFSNREDAITEALKIKNKLQEMGFQIQVYLETNDIWDGDELPLAVLFQDKKTKTIV